MKKPFVVLLAITMLSALGGQRLGAQGRGQGRGAQGGNAPGGDVSTGQPAANGRSVEGGVSFINPGSPCCATRS